jgi:hypothetical protein
LLQFFVLSLVFLTCFVGLIKLDAGENGGAVGILPLCEV